MVFRRGRFFGGAKKRRATTMVGGDELIFGPISGKKSCCDPSILEYARASSKQGQEHTNYRLKQAYASTVSQSVHTARNFS